MACYVKAGQCGNEAVIKVIVKSPAIAEISIETACEYIRKIADELKEIKAGSEMTLPVIETIVYKTAAKHLCRTSCIMPAAILKAIEVEYKLFRPVNASIEFIDI